MSIAYWLKQIPLLPKNFLLKILNLILKMMSCATLVNLGVLYLACPDGNVSPGFISLSFFKLMAV